MRLVGAGSLSQTQLTNDERENRWLLQGYYIVAGSELVKQSRAAEQHVQYLVYLQIA
jgi:hypothetical protein